MQRRVLPQHFPGRSVLGVLAAVVISGSTIAWAADRSRDYRVEVLDQPVAVSAHSEFNIKLTKAATGQPVENAQITRGGLEMTMRHPPHKGSPPGGMTTPMSGEVKLLGTPAPGVYRLMGDVAMPGEWRLHLSAKVPGEPEPIESTTTLTAGQ